ncbi:MAG: polyphosphate kinase 1 [Oscillospiraceae bacterium]|nr:polyphosphate kinase 1 [Oscillospiraceae bacterium]
MKGRDALKSECFENRELSWLRFNARVLEEARAESNPLLERLCFTAIFQNNLDEFFRVRVGNLLRKQAEDPKKADAVSNMKPKAQLKAIYEQVRSLTPVRDSAYHEIMAALRSEGLEQVIVSSATTAEQLMLSDWFKREIRPLSMPVIIDKGKPFPFLRDRALYIVLRLESKSGIRMGILPVSDQCQRMIRLGGSGRFVLAEDIILSYAHTVFGNSNVIDRTIMRVTRSASISPEDIGSMRTGDTRADMELMLQERKRLPVVRLELSETFYQPALDYLCKKLDITPEQVFYAKAPLDLSFAYECKNLAPDPKLQYVRMVPQKSAMIAEHGSMFPQIRKKDILLSYPYESIRPFLRLLDEAADDPAVLSIQITLYRMARDSRVIAALCEAAGRGKEVTALTELRARFDEEGNIKWSKALERAGVRVIYGPENYKVHSKLLLITRKNRGKIEAFTQIGTGNYNEKTAAMYTDYCLMTADKQIAQDAANIFDALRENKLPEPQTDLLAAPYGLLEPVLQMIDDEIAHAERGEDAYIALRMNGLCDKTIMKKLIAASCAGVTIELLVRGICCLIPRIPGCTEHIEVRSIVGRYLEHGRVYFFGSPDRMRVYLGSADFMPRNTVKRVEICAPVKDPALRKRLYDEFRLQFDDPVKARYRTADGDYHLPEGGDPADNSQEVLHRAAYERAHRMEHITKIEG